MTHADTTAAPLVAVIDDEEDVTSFLSLALEDAGYRSDAINDSAEALPRLRRCRPDLICLDLLMPRRMGTSLFVEIRRDRQLGRVPVLILSGLNAREDIQAILRGEPDVAPPDGYLEKPPAPENFVDLVRGLVGPASTDDGSSDKSTGTEQAP